MIAITLIDTVLEYDVIDIAAAMANQGALRAGMSHFYLCLAKVSPQPVILAVTIRFSVDVAGPTAAACFWKSRDTPAKRMVRKPSRQASFMSRIVFMLSALVWPPVLMRL
jgi:hypothetical protein